MVARSAPLPSLQHRSIVDVADLAWWSSCHGCHICHSLWFQLCSPPSWICVLLILGGGAGAGHSSQLRYKWKDAKLRGDGGCVGAGVDGNDSEERSRVLVG
ncbi:hypothetical protein PIB30_072452 [Stylosanthes scabra]|uniref:Uncharacterized protein n=1 Tax=Stylosanthes scabra TaxID=79078 RepID=A0ABU6WSG3_9FABA|nr:hypothetical protein [Stylosanthes scabra]